MSKRKKVSIVYRNIHIYRLVMNILYGMKYKKRFHNVISLFDQNDKKIVELCFGDIQIAEYAKRQDIDWLGLDINESFINYATNKGFNALKKDILKVDIPPNDICIMVGSLYHFTDNLETVIRNMLKNSKKVIISEPIRNLSNNKFLRFIAKKSANAGNGDEEFRYDETSFIATLDKLKEKLSFSYDVISKDRDILVVLKCK